MTFDYPTIPGYSMDLFLLSLINNHIDDLINCYSRLYAVRVDLFYLKESSRYNNSSPRLMEYELRILMASMMEYPAIVGYFCVLEWTEDHGLHAHVVIWLNGHTSRKPYVYAKKASEHWKYITQGEGLLYRCEYKGNYSADIRIPIEHNDPVGISNIRYILSYLAKEAQKEKVYWYLCNEVPLPHPAGRPRQYVATST